MLPAAQDYGLGVIPWCPLHGGLLGGVLRKSDKGGVGAPTRMVTDAREAPRQIEQYEDFCDELGEDPARRGAGLAAAPAGGHRPDHRPAHAEQLDGALRALEIKLDERGAGPARRDLPGAPTAPEDYAW